MSLITNIINLTVNGSVGQNGNILSLHEEDWHSSSDARTHQ